MSNYPPGVTGNEIEIAGVDEEREIHALCPMCDNIDCMWWFRFGKKYWLYCAYCREEYGTHEISFEFV